MADSNNMNLFHFNTGLKQGYNVPTLTQGEIMQTNITISHELLEAAKQRAAQQERSFASYVRNLIRADLEKSGEQQQNLNLKGKKK